MVGDVPVEGNISTVVVPHRQATVQTLAVERRDESVHLPAVVLAAEHDLVVAEILDRVVAKREWLDAPGAAPSKVLRHAHTLRNAVAARIRAEVVVVRMVLLHQDDEMLDRRPGRVVPSPSRPARAGERGARKNS